ncbi:hypothetical protein A3D00_00560 [Candidatus Woesebacteria bacterium RIFCSPHIGHO2_02_FULL_38_9]|uniref:SH3b domain-containing protein n=1 Tax=Candidatus Woesebacteria bacterium RIFCSPHIGHO2_01_FULL_39_28 TaxID=1802496 RepID=A0A1F7YHD9_9BACT|nr:MAG: hypothetical protein A2627_04140 [Candidatus Woesebacteria bacterium RIFCSPHIGHO2_01_FULL_39_28]OGM33222.1 MAG: hypothetical protein A3D00_00560 [Candidatus Woesebacteria bacterium RIFCSPHIGHO2_02_FULL_38_9]OGM58685.1 MAG: hypothetical protein A3A50_02795 [Candidatus Woesebacteria bacterium RIFCSPLOWO2_01_FULL_38_20]
MKKVKIIGLVLFSLGVIGLFGFFAIKLINPKGAAVFVDSNPSSMVFINGEQVGRTPYEGRQKPEEVTIKLVPETFAKPLATYETKVTLISGIKTVVRRSIGESEETSAGEIISFEKTGSDDPSLAVVSNPDAAQVGLDGQIRGFTPLKISSVSPGKHKLSLTAQSYSERSFDIENARGYRLTAVVKLAISGEIPTPTPEQKIEDNSQKKEIMIEILKTPTGFLRVRKEPSTLADEVGRVKPGEKYKLVEVDDKSGWFKIEYVTDKEGWVTNQYARKIDLNITPTLTPSPKATPTPTPTKKLTPTPTPEL